MRLERLGRSLLFALQKGWRLRVRKVEKGLESEAEAKFGGMGLSALG
jgi:hypothetical protein